MNTFGGVLNLHPVDPGQSEGDHGGFLVVKLQQEHKHSACGAENPRFLPAGQVSLGKALLDLNK